MNLRLPLVATVVGIAAAAAGMRALSSQRAAPPWSMDVPAGTSMHAPARRTAETRVPNSTIVVYVAGRVVRSGLYTLPAQARAGDALRAAGGAAAGADLVAVNLAARLADGDEVAVPARGEGATRRTRALTAATGTRSKHSAHNAAKRRHRGAARRAPGDAGISGADSPPTELVDLNAADADVLQTLPGIGPALAERIILVRDQSGPFASEDDLLDVGGMTQNKLDAIAPYITLR